MTTYSPLFLMAALGLLSPAATAAVDAVDTSQWKCEACPYAKGTSGTVDVGVGAVSDDSAKYGDYTGLNKKGAYLILDGTVTHRSEEGYYADLWAADLGLDSRALTAQSGREGLYAMQLGYSEIPRYLSNGAMTPYIGSGGTVLTLPAGFPGAGTSGMPLSTTLQPIDLGFKRKSFDLAGRWIGMKDWTYRVSLRRDVRDGTRPMSVSSYSSATQLAAPVDQITDQLELAASYVGRGLQVALAYQISQFRNDAESLTWANPFVPVVPGATRGQMALAPSNELHQVTGSAAYDISSAVRASADFAVGRMTQNASYLASTLNPGLVAGAGPLPAPSLDGRVDTFSTNLRLTATPMDGLRVNASYHRDVRDNRTAVLAYTTVATDMYVDPTKRSNTPFDLTQDRFKMGADYRTADDLKLSGAIEQDYRQRNYQEVVSTRETTAWGRAAMRANETLAFELKLAHAQRQHSDYGVATWYGSTENPLLRKYNLAERTRNSAKARADVTASEKIGLGFVLDYANDDYGSSLIGLKSGRSVSFGVDGAWAIAEQTQLTAFASHEQINSKQAGSQAYSAPDWAASNRDRFDVLGIGLRHAAIPDKLDIGADYLMSRSKSDLTVDFAATPPPFPTGKTSVDTFKIYGTYKLQEKLSLTASLWYETYRAEDWHLDGVFPATVQSLLALGQQAPNYNVTVLRLALRYQF